MRKHLIIIGLVLSALAATLPAAEVGKGFKRGEVAGDVKDECRRETFTLYSPSMQRDISVRVVLPPEYDAHPDKTYPILYTLHGMGAPWGTYSEMSTLRRQLKDKPMIYTCFDGGNSSWYLDAPGNGMVSKETIHKKPRKNKRNTEADVATAMQEWEKLPAEVRSQYQTFFFDEFVPAIDAWYRVDTARRGITGFSMGGHGALYYMLCRPGFFNSVSGLSSALYTREKLIERAALGKNRFEVFFGDIKTNGAAYTPVLHMERVKALAADSTVLPPVYLGCGTEDRLVGTNDAMYQLLRDSGYTVTYTASPGKHNWPYWRDAAVGVAGFHWRHFTAAVTAEKKK